jgi:hypothetical protein
MGSLILFIILGLLVAIESTTSISRKAGYMINNPSTGFVFQSSLSLVSRALIFMFMPLLGYLADKDKLLSNNYELLLFYMFIPLFLYIVYFFRFKIEYIYSILLIRMDKKGSFFKKVQTTGRLNSNVKVSKHFKRSKKFKHLYNVFLLSYIPYYLSWPIIIFLLQEFHDNRGMILGLSSVFNGINTIAITMFIDPKLTQIGQQKRLIQILYNDLVLLRFYAAMLGYIILIAGWSFFNVYL